MCIYRPGQFWERSSVENKICGVECNMYATQGIFEEVIMQSDSGISKVFDSSKLNFKMPTEIEFSMECENTH